MQKKIRRTMSDYIWGIIKDAFIVSVIPLAIRLISYVWVITEPEDETIARIAGFLEWYLIL